MPENLWQIMHAICGEVGGVFPWTTPSWPPSLGWCPSWMLLSSSIWVPCTKGESLTVWSWVFFKAVLHVVLPRSMLSTGSGEGCHLLGLGECSGTGEEGAAGADGCLIGEAPCDKVNGWHVCACPINIWQEVTCLPLSSAGLACKEAWQVERKSIWLFLPLGWLVPPGIWWFWHVTCGMSQPGRLPRCQHSW